MQDESSRASLEPKLLGNLLPASCSLHPLPYAESSIICHVGYVSGHTLKLCSIARGFMDRNRLPSLLQKLPSRRKKLDLRSSQDVLSASIRSRIDMDEREG